MEMNILEESKGKLMFELVGENHTLCNALREELFNDKDVEVASYNIKHPLTSSPRFIIEAKDPKKSIKEALKRLKATNDEFVKAFAKAK
ncbi:DNA-directed RNA polymerase subunit L [archaeon D22]|nr:DNA-directed RNA polymerase subunit L [archaeon D22]